MKILCNKKATNAEGKISFLSSFKNLELIVADKKEDFLDYIQDLKKRERVVVLGGDGTINLVAQELAFSDIPLGIIPAGKGNDFAKFLELPVDVLEAVLITRWFEKEKVSLGKVNDRFFCNSFGIGFDAFVIGVTQRRGDNSYKLTAMRYALSYEGFEAGLRATLQNGSILEVEDKFLMIVFANGKTEGGGIYISNKDIEDQYITMTVVRNSGKVKRLLALPYFFTPYFQKPDIVESYKIKKAELDLPKGVRKQMDGDVFYNDVKRVQACPQALTVIKGGS